MPDRKMSPPDRPEETYTIDELARITKVPSRTIRYYQAEGLLQWPARLGRSAVYGQHHVERLGFISQMQRRGLRLSAIRALLDLEQPLKASVSDWLGIEAEMLDPWLEQSQTLTHGELIAGLGQDREHIVEELLGAGLLTYDPDSDAYVVPSPRLLDITLAYERAGVDVATSFAIAGIVSRHLDHAIDELLLYVRERMGQGFSVSDEVADVSQTLEVVNSRAVEAVSVLFSQRLRRRVQEFRKLVESMLEPSAPPPRRRRRQRR
jgi:DNA-binding transcriptional MerR regulator